MAVGLVLLAGVLTVFVDMRSTTEETSGYGELQENGRFAMSILVDDLIKQDFWGDYTGTFDRASLNGVAPAAPVNDCVGEGINNGTFPLSSGHFRTLWGQTTAIADPLGCFAISAGAKSDTDIIQIKRVIAEPVTVISPNNYYLETNISDGEIFLGSDGAPGIDNSQIWQYQHHVYYITEQSQGSETIPVLMQGQLTTTMTFAPIIDGIDMLRFMYGVDTDDDGMVNVFLSAGNMTQAMWNNAGDNKIIAVKIYVLARSILPDNNYTDTNTYLLGDLQYQPNDNYRRLLFSSTVTLFNARVDVWPP